VAPQIAAQNPAFSEQWLHREPAVQLRDRLHRRFDPSSIRAKDMYVTDLTLSCS